MRFNLIDSVIFFPFLRAEATSKSETPMKRRTTMYLPLVPRGSLFYTSGSPENLWKILLLYDMFIIEMFIRKMWILKRLLKRCLKISLLKSRKILKIRCILGIWIVGKINSAVRQSFFYGVFSWRYFLRRVNLYYCGRSACSVRCCLR